VAGGSSLHYGDPWSDPPSQRDPLRRLRGRLVLPVTVWTAHHQGETTGLTVSSALLAQGEPAMVAGLLSPASELAGLLESPGTPFVVHVLGASARRLAQHFSGELPAGPEMLASTPSMYGPLFEAAPDRALCRTAAAKPFGWSLLVEATVEEVQLSAGGKGLAWYRGEFHTLGGAGT
jgi:3-hydroxy-9,10-secoandrosta-1,3,5(10)-triene-9,17-dione monooxygenase reductase component